MKHPLQHLARFGSNTDLWVRIMYLILDNYYDLLYQFKLVMRGVDSLQIRFICGKGGVGKTTIATALARIYSNHGGVLLVSVDSAESIERTLGTSIPENEPEQIDTGLWAVHLKQQECLNDFITKFFKIRFLKQWILEHPLYPYISTVAPGIKEYLVLERIQNLADIRNQSRWTTIVVDTPATGHGIHLLNIATPFAAALKLGPLRSRILRTEHMIKKSKQTKAILVTTPSELPVQETIELSAHLRQRLNLSIDCLFINQYESFNLSKNLRDNISRLNKEEAIRKQLASVFQPVCGQDGWRKMQEIINHLHKQNKLCSKYTSILKEKFSEPFYRIPAYPKSKPDKIVTRMTDLLQDKFIHDTR